MGEMADFIMDQAFDRKFTVHREEFDGYCCYDYDEETDSWSGSSQNKQQICKYCGQKELWWSHTDNGYRLVDAKGDIHTCAEYYK